VVKSKERFIVMKLFGLMRTFMQDSNSCKRGKRYFVNTIDDVFFDTNKYEVQLRTWVDKNGTIIREWTPDEYINYNPNIHKKNDGIDCHCREIRKCFATKNGHTLLSCSYVYDYDRLKYESK